MANEIMNKRVQDKGVRGVRKSKSKYSSLLRCAKYGGTYRANTDRGRRFYNCRTKREHGTDACNAFNVNESFIDDKVALFHSTFFKEFMEHESSYATDKIGFMMSELAKLYALSKDAQYEERLNIELKELIEKRNMLLDVYLEKAITKEQFESKIAGINKRLDVVNDELATLSKSSDEIVSELKELDSLRQHLIEASKEQYSEVDNIMSEVDHILVHSMTEEEYTEKVTMYQKGIDSGQITWDIWMPEYNEVKIQLEPKFKGTTLIERITDKYNLPEGESYFYLSKYLFQ